LRAGSAEGIIHLTILRIGPLGNVFWLEDLSRRTPSQVSHPVARRRWLPSYSCGTAPDSALRAPPASHHSERDTRL